ncbi:MAG: hypothetical protein WC848_00315 [Parcubacteria group bacterium]|jgi:chromosome segregation ATPase
MKTKKITTIEDLATLIQSEFLVLGGKIDKLEKRMDSIEKRMDSLEKRMGSLEKRMDSLEVRKIEIKNEIRDVRFELKRKVTRDELDELEKRVIGLEKLVLVR